MVKDMKISGTEIITQSTQNISRNLVIVSSITLLVKYYHVPLDDLKILNVPLPAELFDSVASAIIIFGILSLLIHWSSDVINWRMWVDEGKSLTVLGGGQIKIFKHISEQASKHCNVDIPKIVERLDKIKGNINETIEINEKQVTRENILQLSNELKKFSASLEQYSNKISDFEAKLQSVMRNFAIVSWYGRMLIFFYYLLIPLLIASFAILFIHKDRIAQLL